MDSSSEHQEFQFSSISSQGKTQEEETEKHLRCKQLYLISIWLEKQLRNERSHFIILNFFKSVSAIESLDSISYQERWRRWASSEPEILEHPASRMTPPYGPNYTQTTEKVFWMKTINSPFILKNKKLDLIEIQHWKAVSFVKLILLIFKITTSTATTIIKDHN